MTTKDPYEQGAAWVDRTNDRIGHIMGVLTIKNTAWSWAKPGTYVVITPTQAPTKSPYEKIGDVWPLDAFLRWFMRPDGTRPRPGRTTD